MWRATIGKELQTKYIIIIEQQKIWTRVGYTSYPRPSLTTCDCQETHLLRVFFLISLLWYLNSMLYGQLLLLEQFYHLEENYSRMLTYKKTTLSVRTQYHWDNVTDEKIQRIQNHGVQVIENFLPLEASIVIRCAPQKAKEMESIPGVTKVTLVQKISLRPKS